MSQMNVSRNLYRLSKNLFNKRYSVGMLLIYAQIFCLVTIRWAIPEPYGTYWEKVVMIFLIIEAITFATTTTELQLFNVSISEIWYKYLIAYGLSLFVLKYLAGSLLAVPAMTWTMSAWIALVQLCVVSITEEELRRIIRRDTNVHVACFGFGLLHLAVSGGNIGLMLVRVGYGYGLEFIRDVFSPTTGYANSAVHSAINTISMGLI